MPGGPAVNDLQWKIGGESGFGIKVIGQMFSRLCSRGGLSTFDYTEYPSLIRGGHNAFQVTVRATPVRSQKREVDLLVALNQETVDAHYRELSVAGGILFDPEQRGISVQGLKEQGIRLFPVPLDRFAREAGAELTRNVVALGASVGILNYDFSLLDEVIHTAFDRKGEKLVAANLKAARTGYDYAEKQFSESFPFVLKRVQSPRRMVVSGNTALAMGAIAGGCKYYAAYPMTPSTSILSYLAKHGEQFGMVVRHAEDEIGVINSAIGAAYAGVRSMVGTAGGGYALMVEGTGLAGMLEVPIVLAVGQRPGPSTGLPTWTSQGDLQFVLHAGQDAFPRIVVAPGDAEECFYLTFQAFNLAEKYQTPVFILTDKFLGESAKSVDPFATNHLRFHRGLVDRSPSADSRGVFPRYRITETGVSPRTLPGTPGGVHLANSDEHDEYGFADETAANRTSMMEKRLRKLRTVLADIPPPTLYGMKRADWTMVTWGSTKGPALEALELLKRDGLSVNLLHFSFLFPLPTESVEALFRETKKVMVVEGNANGQFAAHLKSEVGLLPDAVFRKYDGRPFFPEEIAQAVRNAVT